MSIPSKDNEELSQNTKSANLIDQDYLIEIGTSTAVENIFTNTSQYFNNVLSSIDLSYTNIIEEKISMINQNNFSTQINMLSDLSSPKKVKNIPVEQGNIFPIDHLILDCTQNSIDPNYKKYDNLVFETELYKEIESYNNWESSKYDDKQDFLQEFVFESHTCCNENNYDPTDSCFTQCDIDKYADTYNNISSEYSNLNYNEVVTNEYSNVNFKNSLHNNDLTLNSTKEKINADIISDYIPTKSFSLDFSHVMPFNTLIENKKKFQALKDMFFLNVLPRSFVHLINDNITRDLKYRNIRKRIAYHCKWFESFENTNIEIIKNNAEILILSVNTKNLIFDCLEFLKEIAQLILNFRNYLNLIYYNRCDFISNLKLIVTMIDEMLLKVNFEKTKNFMRQILMNKSIYANCSGLKVEKKLLLTFRNIRKFAKKVELYGLNIKRLKTVFEVSFN